MPVSHSSCVFVVGDAGPATQCHCGRSDPPFVAGPICKDAEGPARDSFLGRVLGLVPCSPDLDIKVLHSRPSGLHLVHLFDRTPEGGEGVHKLVDCCLMAANGSAAALYAGVKRVGGREGTEPGCCFERRQGEAEVGRGNMRVEVGHVRSGGAESPSDKSAGPALEFGQGLGEAYTSRCACLALMLGCVPYW